MNEIFPGFACYRQTFFCSEIDTKINANSVKQSGEDEIGTIFFKSDTYDAF